MSLEKLINNINENMTDNINGLMHPTLMGYDLEAGTATVSFPVLPWELNPLKTMHGGMICAAFDMTFGTLAHAVSEGMLTPTTNINITYLRPVTLGDELVIHAKVNLLGKKLAHVSGEGVIKSTGKVAATAQGSFAVVPPLSEKQSLDEALGTYLRK